jgi:hypothetical protein
VIVLIFASIYLSVWWLTSIIYPFPFSTSVGHLTSSRVISNRDPAVTIKYPIPRN